MFRVVFEWLRKKVLHVRFPSFHPGFGFSVFVCVIELIHNGVAEMQNVQRMAATNNKLRISVKTERFMCVCGDVQCET